MGNSDLHQEIARLEGELRDDPQSPGFHQLADAYTRAGRFADAISVCQQGLQNYPEMPEGYVAQGRALFGTGKLNVAIKVLRKAILIPGSGAEPYRLLGEILLRKDAPTEAVMLLEEALERGVDERAIGSLLERARRAVETEQTNVVEMPTEEPRGIGNVAIAGTIGATSEFDLAQLPQPPTIDPPDEVDLRKTPRLDMRPTSGKPSDWSTIDTEWEQELDARNTGFADIESDVGAPFHRPRVDIDRAPLVDPLTEGMPPLPPDMEDSGAIVLPELAATLSPVDRIEAMARREVILEQAKTTVVLERKGAQDRSPKGSGGEPPQSAERRAQSGGATLEYGVERTRGRAQSGGTTPGAEEAAPLSAKRAPREFDALADTMLAIGADPTSPEEKPSEPRELVVSRTPDEVGGFPDLIGLLSTETSALAQTPDEEPLPPTDPVFELPDMEHRIPDPLSEELHTPSHLTPRRSRQGLWMVMVFVVCSAVGGAGVFLWRHNRSAKAVRAALDLGRQARLLGRMDVAQRAVEGIARTVATGVDDPSLTGELELMRALLWLHHGMDRAPAVTASHTPYSHVLARAMVKLAAGDGPGAQRLLEPRPSERLDRGLRSLYVGWAQWTQGHREQAEQQVGEALDVVPGLANALVLRGQMAREVGDLDVAERACGEAVRRSPGHALAMACVAGVTLARGTSLDVQALKLEHRGPVVQGWLELLRAEHVLRDGDWKRGSQLAQAAVAAAPARPDLLFRSVEVLMMGGQLDLALVAWDRLTQVRSTSDPAVRLLHGRLDLSQGLESSALERLKGDEMPLSAKLVRAEALLALGRYSEVNSALDGLNVLDARVLRGAARVLLDRTASLDLLRELAQSSSRARLLLAEALLSRGEATAAIAEAQPLVAAPPFHLAALTIIGRAQWTTDPGKASTTLDEAIRASSARYLPAREVLGSILIDLGRFAEAESTLVQVLKAGRKSLPLALALARAGAMAGHADEAESAAEQAKTLGASTEQLDLVNGHVLLARGKAREATTALARAASVVDLIGLGRASMEAGMPKAAENAFNRAAVLDPVHPLPHLWLGRLLQGTGPTAQTHFDTAIQRARIRQQFPRSIITEATIGLVQMQLARGRLDPAALKVLDDALRATPSSSQLHRLQGEALIKLRRYRPAQKALVRCIELDPSDATAYYLLGSAVNARPQDARRALDQFLKLEPRGKRAAVARHKLARLR